MKIAISAESTIDLTQELLNKYNIKTVPLNVLLGNEEKKDGTFPNSEIFDFVAKTKTLPKTSALNEEDYTIFFNELKKEYDAVIHICISSKISSCCANAQRAAEKLNNVYIVDSLTLSTGIALLAIYARGLADEGMEPSKIASLTQEKTKDVQASFIVEKVDYLYKGGRCSALSMFGANIAKIRPQLVLRDGYIKPAKKYRGDMTRAFENYVNDILTDFDTTNKDIVFITSSSSMTKAFEIGKKILSDYGFKNIYVTNAGCTVSSHCGENTIGVLYFKG